MSRKSTIVLREVDIQKEGKKVYKHKSGNKTFQNYSHFCVKKPYLI